MLNEYKNMDKLIYELGVYLTDKQVYELKIIINNLFNNDLTNIELTSSSGLSVVIINTKDEKYIHQYYISNSIYEKVKNNIQLLNTINIDGFVKIYDFNDELRLIKYQRIVPIIDNQFDIFKLKNDVFKILLQMKKNNISHGDLTLDNIGLDLKANTYLLYDFETMTFNTSQNNDLYTFLKSINFRLGA